MTKLMTPEEHGQRLLNTIARTPAGVPVEILMTDAIRAAVEAERERVLNDACEVLITGGCKDGAFILRRHFLASEFWSETFKEPLKLVIADDIRAAVEAERAAIVAWLHLQSEPYSSYFAEKIHAGEHRGGEG